MSNYDSRARSIPVDREEAALDQGLRKFMLGVYNKMALGLVWSAVVAYAVGNPQFGLFPIVFSAPLIYVVQWGPLALLLGSNFFMRNASPTGSGILYWSVVTLMGAGLGIWVALAMSGVSGQTMGGREISVTFEAMAKAFFVSAAAFGGLSLYGYTTKRNLSGAHSVLVMMTWGLAIIGTLNFALVGIGVIKGSPMIEIIMQVAALGIFSALVATQTNQLRESYYYLAHDGRGQAVMTNYGALNLYIAFITIFQMLLSLFSSRD